MSGDGRRVESVRGDADDVFSHGFLCPKGVSLKELHEDPDRLRTPLVGGRRTCTRDLGRGVRAIDRRLTAVLRARRRDAVAVYLGNPSAHGLSAPALRPRAAQGARHEERLLGLDRRPVPQAGGRRADVRQRASPCRCPTSTARTYLLMLGANPLASNGSLMTAPDVRGRLRAIRARGGRIVVVDPRRTRTAQEADEQLVIRPGTDALLLAALAHVLVAEDLAPRRATSSRTSPGRRGARVPRAVHAGGRRGPDRASTRATICAARARPRGRRARRRLRAHRHDDAALRHRRVAGSSTSSTC